MGEGSVFIGSLVKCSVRALLEEAHRDEWKGVLRLRSGSSIGAIWLVHGEAVHALRIEGKQSGDGIAALEDMARWQEGTYLKEPDALPPARTIRVSMTEILAVLSRETTAANATPSGPEEVTGHPELQDVLVELKERVPGLDSLSLTRGHAVAETTMQTGHERDWLNRQLQAWFTEEQPEPERIYLQQGDHTLLILKSGQMATVLSASRGTRPEALFWAGEEANRRMRSGNKGN